MHSEDLRINIGLSLAHADMTAVQSTGENRTPPMQKHSKHYLCSSTKASSRSGMFPRYARPCLTMARAARHCSVVWLMGWIRFLASSFWSSRSQAVCLRELVLSKCVPQEISRFMMSGWLLDAATCRGLLSSSSREFTSAPHSSRIDVTWNEGNLQTGYRPTQVVFRSTARCSGLKPFFPQACSFRNL